MRFPMDSPLVSLFLSQGVVAPSPQLLRARLLLQLVAESSVRPEPRWQRRIIEAVNQVPEQSNESMGIPEVPTIYKAYVRAMYGDTKQCMFFLLVLSRE